jgi:phosphoglycolate phosphatase-like HAD superfamily hydrolase
MDKESIAISKFVDTIIWDLDGTILNSLEISIGIWQSVLTQYGFPIPSDLEVSSNYHGTLEDTARGLAPSASDDQIRQLLDDFLRIDNTSIKDANHHLYDDAVDLAKRAHTKGLRQILVTNRSHGVDRGYSSPHTLIEGSRLNSYIDKVICGDEVTERKPSKNVLAGILKEGHNSIVIGDQFVDAQFAVNLGCSAILVNRHLGKISHLDKLRDIDELAIHFVDSLYQVII